VAGAVFTLPALYILKLDPHPVQTIFICLAGGCLGVLFLIPLRRYFVREMHGQLPYPEATAITEVLVTGEKGGSQAKLLLEATAIAGVYDFFVTTFHVWKESLDFQFLGAVKALSDRARVAVSFDALGFILGLGYVMGLRSSMILCAGGVLSNLVLVPLIWMIGSHLTTTEVYPGTVPIAAMTAGQIFRGYVRFVGVGAIATAGIFGILKSLRVVLGSFGVALKAFRRGEALGKRTDRDISVMSILAGIAVAAVSVGIFLGRLSPSPAVILTGLALALVFSFFFTSVAANAIATTARNPVSGMTMLTIIISSVVLLRFGVSGTTGMFFVMAIAGMVCTALSVSGQAVTDFKTGYWLGSTPAAQEKVKFLGVIAASVAVGLTIVMLAQAFQFGEASARRYARGARLAPGFHHEGAGRGLHEPAAGGVPAIRNRRGNRGDDGNARRAGPDLRPRHVPAAGVEHSSPGGRSAGAFPEQARRHGARARRDHRVRTDGGWSAGRCDRCDLPPDPGIQRGVDPDAVLRARCGFADGIRGAVYRTVCVRVVAVAEWAGGGRWHLRCHR
jgi:putative OPT family oligopeptide transporter